MLRVRQNAPSFAENFTGYQSASVCMGFKFGVVARKVTYLGTPGYLATDINRQQSSRTLRSRTAPLLHQPYAPSDLRIHFPLLFLLRGTGYSLQLAILLP